MGRKHDYVMRRNFYPHLSGYINIPVVYLEVGVFRGATIKWMLDNILLHPDSVAIGVDPWEFKLFTKHDVRGILDWDNLLIGIECIRTQYGNKVKLIKGYSYDIISDNNFSKSSVDIVYIDGEHTYSAVTNDFNLCWPLLKIGGILIFDDYSLKIRPDMAVAIDRILENKFDKYQLLFKNKQLGIRKLAE